MRFRVAAVAGMVPPALLALATREVDISVLVGWAFALAASTFCPLLLLGVWWPRLTARGAAAGMIAGATVATGMIAAGLISGVSEESGAGAILLQPAVVSVPIAFATMILLSLRTTPQGVGAAMAALHVPEAVSP
jgi:Na+(H+)/acetate symporter ActP